MNGRTAKLIRRVVATRNKEARKHHQKQNTFGSALKALWRGLNCKQRCDQRRKWDKETA